MNMHEPVFAGNFLHCTASRWHLSGCEDWKSAAGQH